MRKFLPLLIILAVLGVAVGAGFYLTRPQVVPAPNPSPAPSSVKSNGPAASPKPTQIKVAQTGAEPPHAVGPADAPVTLEEFGDFQCPPCGLLHPVLKDMEQEFGARLRLIFREFPLVTTHPHAL